MARIEKVLAGEASRWEWALDQLGHIGLGTAYALPVVALMEAFGAGASASIPAGTGTALVGGFAREAYQFMKTGKLHPLDRTLDALFHAPGGAIAYGLTMGVMALI